MLEKEGVNKFEWKLIKYKFIKLNYFMLKIIILTGKKDDVEQAIAELQSNIQYDNLEVKIKYGN